MPIFELFSRRQRRLRGELPDVYRYDEIDKKLRIQIVLMVRDAIGLDGVKNSPPARCYEFIHDVLCREFGVFHLNRNVDTNFSAVYDYFLTTKELDQVLDIIELSYKVINEQVRERLALHQRSQGFRQDPDSAIEELNGRFREAGVGYQFEAGELMRIDSRFMHAETIRPVLGLLADLPHYASANGAFLEAHSHYRHGRHQAALADCLYALECQLKALCNQHKWKFGKSDGARHLIALCQKQGLVPLELQAQLDTLADLLENQLPVPDKKTGKPLPGSVHEVDEHVASYLMHLTATHMLFLDNCSKHYR